MYPDQEINALNDVYEALKGLDNSQIKRIIDWVTDKFALDKHPDLKVMEGEAAPQPVEAAAPAAAPVKKRRGRGPTKMKAEVETPLPQPAEAVEITGLMKYDTFQDLCFSSNAKTVTAKILLAAAYLNENKNIKEFGSSDVNALMKKIGHGVPNISAAINNLMDKNPPLLVQTGKPGTRKHARRTYSVTEEGLRIARNYINE
jgi:hypothetical protein